MIKKTQDLVYPELSYKIVGALFDTYNELGGYLKEKHYQKGLAKALEERGIGYEEQFRVPIKYNNHKIGDYLLDFLIEDKIVIELKIKPLTKSYYDQLLSYLKTTDKKLGIVAIFGSEGLRFKRIVNIY